MAVDEYNRLRKEAADLGVFEKGMTAADIKEVLKVVRMDDDQRIKYEAEKEKAKKKGKPSWTWRNRFEVKNKKAGYRYRFVDRTDASNLSSKLDDGWEFVNRSTGIPGEHDFDYRDVADGQPIDSAHTYREHVLMALPEEVALERDKAVAALTERQTVDIKRRVQSDIGNMQDGSLEGQSAPVEGKVTIIE